jgi:hypothetical protein
MNNILGFRSSSNQKDQRTLMSDTTVKDSKEHNESEC